MRKKLFEYSIYSCFYLIGGGGGDGGSKDANWSDEDVFSASFAASGSEIPVSLANEPSSDENKSWFSITKFPDSSTCISDFIEYISFS